MNFGALPFIDMDRRMRPVEYSPALRLENAAVNTTMFITVPATLDPDLAEERDERALMRPCTR